MRITNYQTGEVCIIDFKAEGWGGKNKHFLEGFCYDSLEDAKSKKVKNFPTHTISGTWSGQVSCQPMKVIGTGKNSKAEIDESVQP